MGVARRVRRVVVVVDPRRRAEFPPISAVGERSLAEDATPQPGAIRSPTDPVFGAVRPSDRAVVVDIGDAADPGLRPAVPGDTPGEIVESVDEKLGDAGGAARAGEAPSGVRLFKEWSLFGPFVAHCLFFQSATPEGRCEAPLAARGLEARRARRSRGVKAGQKKRREPKPPPGGCQPPKASNSAAAERRWVLAGAAWGAS